MEAAKSKTVARAPAPAPAPAAHPVRAAVPPGRVQLQSALKVSSPGDAAEKEAESTARKIVRMPKPPEAAVRPQPLQSPHVARFRDAVAPVVQRKAEGQPNVAANVAAEISASTASGSPLPASVRRFMEPRFKTDFGNVRVHTNERAARLNRQLNAQAFTVGNQIFFGRGRFRPEAADGQELLAHELTHTIQQGATVQRSAEVPVTQQSPQQVQRLGLSDALDYFADRANLIPGFRMLTIILGVNPINMSRVERSAANILRAVIEMIPGGALISQALENNGVFDRVGTWVEQQIRTLGMTGSLIRDAINRFLDSLSWTDIFDLGGVWDRARRIFTNPIDRIISFAGGLVSGIIGFIKDAILRPLARLAEGTRGYDLLKAVLGQDPVTGDPVPRNAETLIGGFMRLIGQEEIWQNIQRSGAVARAWAWFQGALSGLLGFVREIPSLFLQAFRSLEIADIILVPRAFARIASVFGGFVGRFFSWAGETIWNLLEIIFAVVAPGVMVYLRRAAGAFRAILRNPIGFVGNLVRAGILGLRQFATNFLTHLRASLIGWLTGAMSGASIYIPQAFNLREILKFVLSVLGLTWQNIRQKLVRAIGETAVRALETGFDIVMTLVTQGPAAAWEKIQESLSNLRDMVMEQVMTFVRERVVQAAITRLVTSLNPAGAFIQAVIAIYNTVMFFVERLRQIAQVAMSFIDSISAIASGVLTAAANRVEQTMAGLLTLVISFLARIAGLGRVSDAVINVVNRVRQPIDRALDRVVEWIVATARRVGRFIVGAVTGTNALTPEQRMARVRQEVPPRVEALFRQRVSKLRLRSTLALWRAQYGVSVLEARSSGRTVEVVAANSPMVQLSTGVEFSRQEILDMVQRVADAVWAQHTSRDSSQDIERMRQHGASVVTDTETFLPSRQADDLRLAAMHSTRDSQVVVHAPAPSGTQAATTTPVAVTIQRPGGGRFTDVVHQESGRTVSLRGNLTDYDSLVGAIRAAGHSSEEIAQAIESLRQGRGIPLRMRDVERQIGLLRNLLLNVEVQRDVRNVVFSPMAIGLMGQGASAEQVLGRTTGIHPATMIDAGIGFTGRVSYMRQTREGPPPNVHELQEQNRGRQVELVRQWFEAQIAAGETPVVKTINDLEAYVRQWVERYFQERGRSR